MNDAINNFNIRVYGLLVQNDQVLISREVFQNKNLIKFPGGGLEYGESIKKCLHREWQEETGVTIQIHSLFYFTEHFIQSAFNPKDQIISFYYLVSTKEPIPLQTNEHKMEWVDLNDKKIELTFSQDKKVFQLLQSGNI